jgi:cellulose synthase/poly-beta-1,6-N-acetylglucosamine synthase-like glycosyltransferase
MEPLNSPVGMIPNHDLSPWLPAAQIFRPFVKYPSTRGSPGDYCKIPSKNHPPDLSVIIPTLDANREGYFFRLLAQIKCQNYSRFEVIVVRGDSQQGRAINIAASLAKSRYLLTMDDDTSLSDPDAFRKLLAVMEKYPDIGLAGGNNVVPEDASGYVKRAMRQIPRRSWEPVKMITDSDLAEHPLLMVRKDAFFRVGGENERLPRGLDPYLRHQFRKAGYRVVVVPEVIYSHLPPRTFEILIKQFYRNGKAAAFCNKFYPQWIFEAPASHITNFTPHRPFLYRCIRYVFRLVKKVFMGHWVYVSASIVYAVGFAWGYIRYKDKNQI